MGSGNLSLLLLLSSVLWSGCQPASQGGEKIVVDDLGRKVKIRTNVQRVVSLVPTNSELVCILDCTRLKAGTRYDRFPEELLQRINDKKIEILGGGFDPNLEKIVQIGPDLILSNGSSQDRIVLPLRRLGYSVLSVYPQDLPALKKDVLLLGHFLEQEEKARQIVDAVETGLSEVQRKTAQRKPKRVYLQTSAHPMLTVGQASFAHWLLSLAGGTNVFADLPFDSSKVSVEWVIQRNPEVLILVGEQEEFVKRNLGRSEWSLVEGVKNRHICIIEASVIRRTIRLLEGVEEIYNCLWRLPAHKRHSDEPAELFASDSPPHPAWFGAFG